MQPDFSSDRPIFLQIADMLEEGILSGAFPEEDQVPSITEFSVSCKINPATALKGINMLVDEGVLYKKRGLGMFVAGGARQKLRAKRKDSFYTGYVVKLADEALRLELTQSEVEQMLRDAFSRKQS